ncbi:HAD family hydrolase, partial [Streptomyces hirsutus]|uniref:HAD family hydrolase n=1 Tax=Streptomyces hirsutus TaxID=35620 RepID=UPI003665B4F0
PTPRGTPTNDTARAAHPWLPYSGVGDPGHPGARGKPHPDPYLAACRGLGIRPQRTLVFEDSVSGVRSAVTAGAVCIGIGGPGLVEAGAVIAVPDFTALALGEGGGGAITLTDPDGLVTVVLAVGPDGG